MKFTDRDIRMMAQNFANGCDPLNNKIEKQADIMLGYIKGFRSAMDKFNNGVLADVSKPVCMCRNSKAKVLPNGDWVCKACGLP